MALSKGSKFGIAAAVLTALGYFGYKALPTITKAKNLLSNLLFEIAFHSVFGLAKGPDGKFNGKIRVKFMYTIQNLSGFNLSTTNVFAIAESSIDGGKTWNVEGSTPVRVSKIDIPDGKTVNGIIDFDLKTSILNVLNSKQPLLRITTTYHVNDIQQKIATDINLTTSRDKMLSSIRKLFGLTGVEKSTPEVKGNPSPNNHCSTPSCRML